MTTLSLLITLLAVTVAGAMAVLVARMRRDERDRSAARVAALAEMAAPAFLPEPEPFSLLPNPVQTAVDPQDRFTGDTAADSHWRPRLAIAGGILAVVLTVLAVALYSSPATDAWMARDAAPPVSAPLELRALDQTREEGRLTVSGWVANPRGGAPAANLTATVFLFGPDGSFLTSGRAPLHAGTLQPGTESAFLVAIPVNGTVARYRVSFRDSAGHAVAHVDKRTAASVARNE